MHVKGSYKKAGLHRKNHSEVFIKKFKTIVVDVNVEDAVVEEKKLKVNTKGSYKKKRKIPLEFIMIVFPSFCKRKLKSVGRINHPTISKRR
jgi:hypothetical protein